MLKSPLTSALKYKADKINCTKQFVYERVGWKNKIHGVSAADEFSVSTEIKYNKFMQN